MADRPRLRIRYRVTEGLRCELVFCDGPVLACDDAELARTWGVWTFGETIEAHDGFLLCLSYNPGYQSIQKNLKHSTRQRFVTIEFNYPPAEKEVEIIAHESGVDRDMAARCLTQGRGEKGQAALAGMIEIGDQAAHRRLTGIDQVDTDNGQMAESFGHGEKADGIQDTRHQQCRVTRPVETLNQRHQALIHDGDHRRKHADRC